MNTFLEKNDRVIVCYKDTCIHAHGHNADKIANALFVMLLLIGVAILYRAASN